MRAPSDLDRRIAEQLKLDCLEALAAEAGVPLLRAELEAFIERERELARPLAMVIYVRELTRRSGG